jgi:hypothetical protein
MTKSMSKSKVVYLFLFLVIAFGVYYVFGKHLAPAHGGYKNDKTIDWLDLQKKELQDKIKQNAYQNR